jgi:hypothetical protein
VGLLRKVPLAEEIKITETIFHLEEIKLEIREAETLNRAPKGKVEILRQTHRVEPKQLKMEAEQIMVLELKQIQGLETIPKTVQIQAHQTETGIATKKVPVGIMRKHLGTLDHKQMLTPQERILV